VSLSEIDAEAAPARADRSARPRWRKPLATSALVIGVLALAALAFVRYQRGDVVDPRRVVIVRLENKTDDSTLEDFGAIATEVVTEQLARTAIVGVVDPTTALASSNDVRRSAVRLDTHDAVGNDYEGAYRRSGDVL
jgi:hypothetical protein